VDVNPINADTDPAQDVTKITTELEKFSTELAARERWLVCNKIDLLPPDDRVSHCQALMKRLQWTGPMFMVSALTGEGTGELMKSIWHYLHEHGTHTSTIS
jgi:GTP-binding protein